MIGDVSAAVGCKNRDIAPRQQLAAGHDVLWLGIPAQGQHRGVLDQQEHIADTLLMAQRAQPLLQGQRRGVIPAAEIDQRDNHA